MRGVDLNVFAFDYDLTWAAVLMNAEGTVYGRFGGRDAESPDKYLTLTGLTKAMRAALDAHRKRAGTLATPAGPPRFAEEYPAARRMKPGACIHCHQVYDFRREAMQGAGTWRREEAWVYPTPETIGLTLDADDGSRVAAVKSGSPVAKVGLRAGDSLVSIAGRPVASFADVQHALHLAPPLGKVTVAWRRGSGEWKSELDLPAGWRVTDIAWRASMWGLRPDPAVHGADLGDAEKKRLGLPEKRLAFRQAKFVPPAAKEAGVREDDIILGLDDKPMEMTMLQFNAHVRLHYQVGDRVTLNILRGGKRVDLPMTLK